MNNFISNNDSEKNRELRQFLSRRSEKVCMGGYWKFRSREKYRASAPVPL